MIYRLASSATNVSSKELVDEQSRRGEKKEKRRTRGFFNVKHEPTIQNEINVKFISTNGHENGRILFFFFHPLFLFPVLLFLFFLTFPSGAKISRHDSSLSLPSLIHSLLPCVQCHRRHFNSRHDALVFFRMRADPTDYKMDVGRLMKYLKVSSGGNPRGR